MTKGTLGMATALLFCLCLSLFGQTQQTNVLSLRTSSATFQQLALADGTAFSFPRAPVWTQSQSPITFPTILVTGPRTAAANKSATDAKDYSKDYSKDGTDSKDPADITASSPVWVHGEMGAMFGVSTGRFAHDFEAGYINGTVGNDKFQISAGGSYENTNYHFGRR